MNTPPRPWPRRIVHLIAQTLLLFAAAVNLFFAAVVVFRAWWLTAVFLVAAVVTVLGVAIEKGRWLVTGAMLSTVASAAAIRLRAPIDEHQPLTTGGLAMVLIGAWWISQPHFVRRFPFTPR